MKKGISSWKALRMFALAGVLGMLWGGMTGCGLEAAVEGDAGAYEPRERVLYDLASNQWKEQKEAEDGKEPWQYAAYWEEPMSKLSEAGMRRTGRWTGVWGTDFYWLESYLGKEEVGPGARKCYLTCLDTLTMESVRTEFRFTGISGEAQGATQELAEELARDLDENWLEITGMDIQNDKICLLAAQMDSETKKIAGYYVIWADKEGKVESAVDLLPEMKASGMMEDNFLPEGILCDGEGRVYIGNSGLGYFGIFDSDGKFVRTVEPPKGAGSGVSYMGRLPDGRPIFGCSDSGGEDTILFACEGAEEKLLYEGRCTISEQGYPNAYGEILFMENGGLMRWDGATGKCLRLYQDSNLASLSGEAIIEHSGEEMVLVLYDEMNGVTVGVRLQLGPKIEEEVLTLFWLDENQGLKNCIEDYNRKHPGVKIELASRNPEEDMDMALTRLTKQISEGEGPDLMAVPLQHFKLLQGKDMLADLTGVLPKEVEEQIFPGVLRCGMVDGKLYGIVSEAAVNTVAVSGKVWQEDTWNYKDVMDLTEGDGGPAGKFADVFGNQSPLELLKFLVVTDVAMGMSSFVDYEQKECRFDSEDFVSILEFSQKYGTASGGGNSFEEEIKKVQEGKTLAHRFSGNLMGFSRHMAALGEGYKCVGYPTEGEYGGYFECYYCVCVNVNSEKKDLVYDVLGYLLGDSGQRKMGITTVRKDILSACVEDGTQSGEGPVFRNGMFLRTPLEGRADGSSFLPEYMEILENGKCVSGYGPVEQIIIEEAAAYFEGDKTAKEAAEIIQNRVRLYLKESSD